MILIFEIALLITLLYCLPLLKRPAMAALFYWLGWFTPWVIPHVTRDEVGFGSLLIATLVFFAAWAVFELSAYLNRQQPPPSWRWIAVGAAAGLLVLVF